MPKRHYTIYCDESSKKGRYFSNFYGSALILSADRQAIEKVLREKKEELNIFGEMKWTKVTKEYQEKYVEFVRLFFDFVASGRIKIRIMFTQNYHRPKNLTDEHRENEYYLLYYQMLKHAFGLRHCNPNGIDRVFITTLLDDMPDNKEKIERFRNYICSISQTHAFSGCGVFFPKEQIAHVNSHEHDILQGLDIILGSMFFRLNDLHKAKPDGAKRRGKRTIAKEAVYKEINRLIRGIYPNFNIGASTGTPNGYIDRWEQPYRHWRFVPKEFEFDEEAVKPR
ncbi:MAG: DUF3800 domain-containing protein [Mesorhizobium sp.]|nr:DUF3800 domain-containing protein [Mesorhizobium sp. M8A.F.Ca.ET.023.01.1.1]RWC69752.1 MAG: DUF3800 domain-containing protein [Mesorhizobium sp.]